MGRRRARASLVRAVSEGRLRPARGLGLAALYTFLATPVRRSALPVVDLGLLAWGGTHLLLAPADPHTAARLEAPLVDLEGEATALGAYAAGRPLVVNLWAPWCPGCRREMPMIAEAADADPGVAFALVDRGSSEREARGFLDDAGLAGAHVLLDPRARLGSELDATGLATTLVFDADGALAYAHVGEISRAGLERRVEEVAEGP